jgi:N-methylhydantoinase B
VNPISYQVIVSRLSGIVQEMQENVFRTGYSTIIRESQDASCMLLDAAGDVVGEHVVLPLHVSCLPEVVRAIVRRFGDDIGSGDAFITNHPYEGGVPHSMDMAVVTPFFRDGRLMAFCGSIAHKSDLGGVVPGTGYGSARELFQEGVQYPPMRLVAGGATERDVEALLRANSRTPELIFGDIRGQIGVARLAERRLGEMFARYGSDACLQAFARRQRLTEERIRAVLRGWPDGAHEAEAFVDNDGVRLDVPIRYHVRVDKRGERIAFDFSQSDDQAAGPVNITPPLARACVSYALIAMVDAGLPNNGGVARVIETTFRKGSVLNPHFPAPCNTYMASSIAITEASLDALGRFTPDRRIAGNGGVGGFAIGGKRADGSAFVQYESVGSAYGGTGRADGLSGTAVLLSNARTAPIEVLESEYPTRVRRWELVTDSGGPGRFRGGLAPRRDTEILTDDAQLTLRGGRHEAPAYGREGGEPGRLGALVVNPESDAARALPSRFSGLRLRSGDLVRLEKAGGGGLGDPHQRPFEAIVDDVIDGYVTREAALAAYGVAAERLDAALAPWVSASRWPVSRTTPLSATSAPPH